MYDRELEDRVLIGGLEHQSHKKRFQIRKEKLLQFQCVALQILEHFK